MKCETLFAGFILASSAVYGAWPYDQVDKVDLDPLETVVSGWKGAAPQKGES